MNSFVKLWLDTVKKKNSLLCVGIDPAEFGQRSQRTLKDGESKVEWAKKLIKDVAPYAAAVKPNRNYFKDISRAEMKEINDYAHSLGMLTIDDSKIADIGDTNDSAVYHAAKESFDFITYAPFPGNIEASSEQGRKHKVGIITLALMSNPEYALMKNAIIDGEKAYKVFCQKVATSDGCGVVIGAPSDKNHLEINEIETAKEILSDRLVLVPGVGAQGGDCDDIIRVFGNLAMINVGRAIAYAQNPAFEAKKYQEEFNKIKEKYALS